MSRRLLRLLSGPDSTPSSLEDRRASERLWVLFVSALENFLSDLRKARDLSVQFRLTQRCDRRSLVNTGQLPSSAPSGHKFGNWWNHPLLLLYFSLENQTLSKATGFSLFPRMYRWCSGRGSSGGINPGTLAHHGGGAKSRSSQSHCWTGGHA